MVHVHILCFVCVMYVPCLHRKGTRSFSYLARRSTPIGYSTFPNYTPIITTHKTKLRKKNYKKMYDNESTFTCVCFSNLFSALPV